MDEFQRKIIAESYLDHILISLRVNDPGAPYRDFFDNWYAYEVGGYHLTAKGKPHWFNKPNAAKHQLALSEMHFISEGAEPIIRQARLDKLAYSALYAAQDKTIQLMVDHAIPLTVLVHILRNKNADNRDSIRNILLEFYRVGVLTKEEDERLNEFGLRSKMPHDWNESDLFSRYKVANIRRANVG